MYSFSYPEFWTLRNDPMYIYGFILAHFCLIGVVLSLLAPRFFDVFVPTDRQLDGVRPYAPNVTEGLIEGETLNQAEAGHAARKSSEETAVEKKL